MPVAPAALVDEFRAAGLPFAVLHREARFVAITEAVHSRIIAEQMAALRARDDIHALFTELSLRGSPADFIVEQAARVLGCAGRAGGHSATASSRAEGSTPAERRASSPSGSSARGPRTARADTELDDHAGRGARDALGAPRRAARRAASRRPLERARAGGRRARAQPAGRPRRRRVDAAAATTRCSAALLGRRFAGEGGARAHDSRRRGSPCPDGGLVGRRDPRSRSGALPARRRRAGGGGARGRRGRRRGRASRAPGHAGRRALRTAGATSSTDRCSRRSPRSAGAARLADRRRWSAVGADARASPGCCRRWRRRWSWRPRGGGRRAGGRRTSCSGASSRPLLRLVNAFGSDPRLLEHTEQMLRPLIEYDLANGRRPAGGAPRLPQPPGQPHAGGRGEPPVALGLLPADRAHRGPARHGPGRRRDGRALHAAVLARGRASG